MARYCCEYLCDVDKKVSRFYRLAYKPKSKIGFIICNGTHLKHVFGRWYWKVEGPDISITKLYDPKIQFPHRFK